MPRFLIFLFSALTLSADEQPHILWITSEDNDKYWLGCYGNEQANTPHLDALAKRSVRFENFYSNAPVCAVARSTILNGVYATSQGTQHMRSRHVIPANIKPYVHYLREAGYYTTNASKTDYNFQGADRALWHECDKTADYKNRKEGQPFFAIFNLTESHESSLFPDRIASQRKKGFIPQTPSIHPDKVLIRPYLPDLPDVRHDLAVYHDNITLMDQQVGEILQTLTKRGLAEDTIIFYFSDHGGITPRGKRYLKDTGVNVPLLIHFPEKWKHLSPFEAGSVTHENASFVDLAPTLLSLLAIEKPSQMQGRAILGPHREDPTKENFVFLFADRFDEIYGMRRGITDGRWKYIRRFAPRSPAAPYSYYQFGQKAWNAWKAAWEEGSLEPQHARIWEKNQAVEELFDTKNDRWEINNLATDPAHATRLKQMRETLKKQMSHSGDTGLIPEPMFAELASKKPIRDYLTSRRETWPSLVDFAFTATSRAPETLPLLLSKLESKDPLERYWATQGCLNLGDKATSAEKPLRNLLTDSHSAIRASAAHSLITLGKPEEGYLALLNELSRSENNGNNYATLNVINILTQLDALSKISDSWIEKTLNREDAGKYVERFAKNLAEKRGL